MPPIDISRPDLVDAPSGVADAASATGSHYRGFDALGEFQPDAQASAFVDHALFDRRRTAVSFRFSVCGHPPASDKDRSTRGMACRLQDAESIYDMVMLSEPVFAAATPASLLAGRRAHRLDPANGLQDARAIAAYERRHPDGARLRALLAGHAAPASHATTPYYSNHAFLFTGRDGTVRAGRLLAQPDAGTRYLSVDDEARLGDKFLEREIDERLLLGPIGFVLYAQLPGPGDALDDPSCAWLGMHHVVLGRLRVLALSGDACASMDFSPTNLPPGVAPANDPFLRAWQSASRRAR